MPNIHKRLGRNKRRGITNVLGALLFVFALVSLTSLIAVVANEYSSYVRSAEYINTIERERSNEGLSFSYSVISTQLRLNMTNTGSETLSIVYIVVHNKTATKLSVSDAGTLPVVLNPGMTEFNYLVPGVNVTSSSNATILVVTERGNTFVIAINGGNVICQS